MGEFEILDPRPVEGHAVVREHTLAVRSAVVEAEAALRRVPRHVFNYSLTLIVNGEPQVISDSHAVELGCFACVNQKNGTTVNDNDRSRALVVVLPRGNFECIDLDNPRSMFNAR